MKRETKLVHLLLILLTMSSLTYADPIHHKAYPVNAYSAGMGFTGVATLGDPSLIYWNPAGLGAMELLSLDFTAVGSEVELPGSWSFLMVNSSSQDVSKVGFGAFRHSGFIDSTVFTSFQFITPLAYGFQAGKFPIGFSFKFISTRFGDAKWKFGSAMDLGTLWLLTPNMSVGYSVQNFVGSNLQTFESKSHIGFAWQSQLQPLTFTMQARADRLFDSKYIRDNYSVGANLFVPEARLNLRTGYIASGIDEWVTMGIRFTQKSENAHIDYAFCVNPVDWTHRTHFITYGYSVKPGPKPSTTRRI